MPSKKQVYGTMIEDQADGYLRHHGYEIMDHHVTSRYGELDILAKDGETIVAVEVRAKRSHRFGRAVESITPEKLRRVERTLQEALYERGWFGRPHRIDVLTLDGHRGEKFELYKGVELA